MTSTLVLPRIRGMDVLFIVWLCSIYWWLESPIFVYDIMYYEITFWTHILMKNSYDDRLFYLHVYMCFWMLYHLWNKCQSSTRLAYESRNWWNFLAIWMYVMFSNFCSNNLTRKNIHNNVGSLTWYKPLSCETTKCESRCTSRERTPCEMESRRSSIMPLYSSTLLEDVRRHMPPEEST